MPRYEYGYGWRPYVSVAERRRRAARKMASLRNEGVDVQPVEIDGRKIAKTFWSEAWCDHLESFSDYSNRLPRGGTYVRNGSVCHLVIRKGNVEARVAGSELYTVDVQITELPAAKWRAIKRRSAGKIGSLLELLHGKLSDEVMRIVTDRNKGLFPLPKEISFCCDCPDWAGMCKHIAAVMYGVAARLDVSPDLLFTLRGVDHEELIAVDAEAAVSAATSSGKSKQFAVSELSDVFGIDLDSGMQTNSRTETSPAAKLKRTTTRKLAKKKPTKKRPATRKTPSPKKAKRAAKGTAKRKSVKTKKKQSTASPGYLTSTCAAEAGQFGLCAAPPVACRVRSRAVLFRAEPTS